MANNDGAPPECGFLAGFALALGYTRLVGMLTAAEQETVFRVRRCGGLGGRWRRS